MVTSDNLANKILVVATDMVNAIKEHFETKELTDVEEGHASKFITLLRSVNIYALSSIGLPIELNEITTRGVTGETETLDRIELLMTLKNILLINFVRDDLDLLIDVFAASNAVGSIVSNEADASGTYRYATTEQLQTYVNNDPTIMVLWFLRTLPLTHIGRLLTPREE